MGAAALPIAIGGGAIAEVAGGLLGARAARKGTKAATEAQLQGILASIGEQRRQFDISRELLEPFREAGVEGLEAFKGLAISPEADPGFLRRLDESRTGLERFLSARGLLRSGFGVEQSRELEERAIEDAQSRRFRRLSQLVNIGRGAAGTISAGAQRLGESVGGLLRRGGQITGAGLLTSAQQRAGMFGSIGQTLAQLPLTIETGRLLKRLGRNGMPGIERETTQILA